MNELCDFKYKNNITDIYFIHNHGKIKIKLIKKFAQATYNYIFAKFRLIYLPNSINSFILKLIYSTVKYIIRIWL